MKHESHRRVTKRRKKYGKRKVSTSGEDSDSLSTDYASPTKKENKTLSSSPTASSLSTDKESQNDRF